MAVRDCEKIALFPAWEVVNAEKAYCEQCSHCCEKKTHCDDLFFVDARSTGIACLLSVGFDVV